MEFIPNTNERIQFALKQMKKAMPAVRKQVARYERNVALGKTQNKPEIAPQFKNV